MIRRCTAWAFAALVLLGVNAGTVALAQPPAHWYYTELYRYPEGGFPVSAYLELIFQPNGSIIGYYRPTEGTMNSVMGSISGTHVSLTVGGVGGLQVNGTMKDGKITGRAFRSFGREIYSFIARPVPNYGALPRER